jgi:phosphohistidine swiveling domain-containing protein
MTTQRWLLSGQNPQENLGVARTVVATVAESRLHEQIQGFLDRLAGDAEGVFDPDLRASTFVQGRWYLNITYFVAHMGVLMPFDPESLGVPPSIARELTEQTEVARLGLTSRMGLPVRFMRAYRQAAEFHRDTLPALNEQLTDIYWQMRQWGEEEPPEEEDLDVIWSLFEEGTYEEMCETRHNLALALMVTALDSVVRQQVPQLLGLFAGRGTAISLISQRMWELGQQAKACGPEVERMLREGNTDLEAYRALPEAAPFVAGVEEFIHIYGHRGFQFEFDWKTDRLADQPGYVLLAVANQLDAGSPAERSEASREVALNALRRLDPARRALWQRVLNWGQQLISWREQSKSHVALFQAAYGLAARHLARYFYPDQPDDTVMFYTIDEFLDFVRSHGEKRVEQAILDGRRAQFELQKSQTPPPELIWYDPETRHWEPAQAPEKSVAPDASDTPITLVEGVAASGGSGPVEGMALVTNDPFEAGRRLLELEGDVVLVTRLTDPAWSAIFPRLSGVVTELGGVVSHAAIVARENGLPAVVGVPQATQIIRDGQRVRVDGMAGKVEIVE